MFNKKSLFVGLLFSSSLATSIVQAQETDLTQALSQIVSAAVNATSNEIDAQITDSIKASTKNLSVNLFENDDSTQSKTALKNSKLGEQKNTDVE